MPDSSSRTVPAGPDFSAVPEAGARETSTRAALRDPRRLRTEILAGLVVGWWGYPALALLAGGTALLVGLLVPLGSRRGC